MNQEFDNTTKAGTIGGTLLTIFVNIHGADLLKTGILAAVGAIVSYCVTRFIKFLIKQIKK